jgi:hypothetical protein
MDINAGFVALIGLGCLLWPVLFFLALRRVNRFVIVLLAVAFACFGIASGLVAWEDYQQGIAHIPSGRRTTTEITQGQHPALFWVSTTVVWLCIAGLLSMSAYLLRIALMRRRQRA